MIDNVLFIENIHDNTINTTFSVCEEKDCKWQ